MQSLSSYVIPLVFLLIIITGLCKKIDVFSAFLDGIKEGMATAESIFPALLVLVAVIGIFKISGALDLLVFALEPFAKKLKMPGELLPLALLRPLSGSGAVVIFSDILEKFGPDSALGRTASVMMGSTETTFYTIALYYGAAKITKTRHTLPCAVAADLTGFWMSVLAVKLFFH